MQLLARAALLLALLAAPWAAHAQTVTGTITGIVKDASGGVLPGVTVTMTQSETGRQETAVTDTEGRYTSQPLQLGTYRIEAALTGFKASARAGIALTIDDVARVDFTLDVGTRAGGRRGRAPRPRWSTPARRRSASSSTTAASRSCR